MKLPEEAGRRLIVIIIRLASLAVTRHLMGALPPKIIRSDVQEYTKTRLALWATTFGWPEEAEYRKQF